MANIKIISWNINGIRAVVKKGFVNFLYEYKPHIIGLQEVKIDAHARNKETFDFPKYNEYWHSSKRPGYAGTMTLVRETSKIATDFIRHIEGINHTDFDHEGRVQTVEFEKFFLINIYFPNTRDDLSRLPFKQEFNAKLLVYAKKLEKKKPVIMMGDFNVAHNEIDLARPKENSGHNGFTDEERSDFDNFEKKCFVDTFRHFHPHTIKYSWWSYRAGARQRNVGWRIDYIMVSKVLLPHVKKSFILNDVVGSDHCPVGIELDI